MKTFLCSHLVMLRWNDRELAVNLESISSAVASVNAEEALPLGEAVVIAAEECQLAARVSACQNDPFGLLIDLELDEPWSPEVFLPDHFFDPCDALAREDNDVLPG